MNMNGGAPTGPAVHRHNTRTLDRITGISADRNRSSGRRVGSARGVIGAKDHSCALASTGASRQSGRASEPRPVLARLGT